MKCIICNNFDYILLLYIQKIALKFENDIFVTYISRDLILILWKRTTNEHKSYFLVSDEGWLWAPAKLESLLAHFLA